MNQAWKDLQVAQRALALGDLAAALTFAKRATMVFKLTKGRQVPTIPIERSQNAALYQERILMRLQKRGRRNEKPPEPLGEARAGLAAAERIIDAVVRSAPEGKPAGPSPRSDRAAVLGHLREGGTAEIIAYLPTTEPADDLYFERLHQHVKQGQSHGRLLRTYQEEPMVEDHAGRVVGFPFTIVGKASVCRLSVSRWPHFQVIGEMTAPMAEAEAACREYVALLDKWLNLPEEDTNDGEETAGTAT